MSKKNLSILLIIMAILISVFSFSVQAKTTVLRYALINSEKSVPHGPFTSKFAELVEEKTEGRVKIDIYWDSSLVGYDIEPVQTGIADFNQLTPGVVADLDKELVFFDLPYMFTNYEQALKIADPRSPVLEKINEDLSKTGVRLLTAYPTGFRNLTTTNSANLLVNGP